MRNLVLGLILGLLLAFTPFHTAPVQAQDFALAGQVSSAEEGPMEGVLVSAKKAGSTITVTVVTDAQGPYSFPRARLEPGNYALRIRAVGYDLERPVSLDVAGEKPVTCVDGPRLARAQLACCTEVACSHVSGLSTQSGRTAGPDGVREPSPHHSSGIDVPVRRQVCLGCVGSTDCAITRHCSLASSST